MVAWGDVPTWVTAGVAFMALIGASLAYRTQSEQLRLQRIQFQDQTRIQEREQADQIDVVARTISKEAQESWLAKHQGELAHPHAHSVVVTNGSKRPIREVACKVEVGRNDGSAHALGEGVYGYMAGTDFVGHFIERGSGSTMPVLRAGMKAGFAWSGAAEYPRIVWTVRFTDDAGRHWEIDTDLHLRKLDHRDW